MATFCLTPVIAAVGILSCGTIPTFSQELPTAPVFDAPEGQSPAPIKPHSPAKPSAAATTPPLSLLPWEAEFSNLPASQRAQYAKHMQQAKAAYQAGNSELCILALGACELIFDKNPHALNLKISCLLDLNKLDELPTLLKRSRELLPENEVADFSESSLLLAQGQYDECIAVSQRMLNFPGYQLSSLVRDLLCYRILLCHLAVGRTGQAKELVAGLSPLADTPLYYMSEVAFAISEGRPEDANRNMKAAMSIFGTSGQLVGFIRAFNQSNLADKSQSTPSPAPAQ